MKCAGALVAAALSWATLTSTALADYEQLHRLTSADIAIDDYFGDSVAVRGTTAIVGVPADDDGGNNSGSAYLFDTATGKELIKLTAPDAAASTAFGASVAVNENIAMVGASHDDHDTGALYLFDVTTGAYLSKLKASDARWGSYFGFSTAASGNTAIVGAGRADNGAGAAYIFDVTTGGQLHKLQAADAHTNAWFGCSVAIDGDFAIVGAKYHEHGGSTPGSAYVYDTATGAQLLELVPSDAAVHDQFGISVGISGGIAIVGAHGDDDLGSASGSVYLFDVTTGEQLAKLHAPDGRSGDRFGWSVALSGNIAVIGADGDDDGGSYSGSAYVFDITTGEQLAKLTGSDPGMWRYFGFSVGISDGTVIVGAPGNRGHFGAAYVFGQEQPPLEISVDIITGSDTSPVNPRSRGVLAVAILGSEDFDVSGIDISMLELEGAEPRARGQSGMVGLFRDVNGDSSCDLILHFDIGELKIALDATELTLFGALEDGTEFTGTDSIRIVPGPDQAWLAGPDSGTSGLPAAHVIPEPATLALLAAGGLALLRRRLCREW